MAGGNQQYRPVAGTVLIDSIGLGDTLVPYQYCQGTSMAAPVTTGAAAVLAERFPNDTADERAARMKGSASAAGTLDWSEYCLTGGMVDIDKAATPDPVIDAVTDNGSTVTVSGWFIGDDTQVAFAGTAARVLSREPSPDNPEHQSIVVEKPAGLAGGRTEVTVSTPSLASGRYFATLKLAATGSLYDQANLPVPEELQQWSSWQLVGSVGKAYCLPRYDFTITQVFDHLYAYDPVDASWGQVPIPPYILEMSGRATSMMSPAPPSMASGASRYRYGRYVYCV